MWRATVLSANSVVLIKMFLIFKEVTSLCAQEKFGRLNGSHWKETIWACYILRHICWRQELWIQQRQPLFSNGFANKHVSTTIGYNNNGKRRFLRGPCRDVINRHNLESVSQSVSHLVDICCSWGRRQFGNPKDLERPSLEAVTRRLVKIQQAEKNSVFVL
jgi:hypothetical protein